MKQRECYARFARNILSFFQGDKMKYFILTNNSLAAEELGNTHEIRFVEGELKDVFIEARDLIHQGAVLLNHPLYGSVKPNETPYRSLLLHLTNSSTDSGCASVDPESVRLIGNAVSVCDKFTAKKETTDPRILQDFQVVDLSLLKSAMESADR